MPCGKKRKKMSLRKLKKVEKGVKKSPWIVHYRYSTHAAICGTRRPYANTHLLGVVSCKKCKKVIRGMLRG